MNRYIIPVCIINNSDIFNEVIVANSLSDCKDQLMERYIDYSDKSDWNEFIEDLDRQDVLVGNITDIETI